MEICDLKIIRFMFSLATMLCMLTLFGCDTTDRSIPPITGFKVEFDGTIHCTVEDKQSKFGILDITDKPKWIVKDRDCGILFVVPGSTPNFMAWIEGKKGFHTWLKQADTITPLEFGIPADSSLWPNAVDAKNKRLFANVNSDVLLESNKTILSEWALQNAKPEKISEVIYESTFLSVIIDAQYTHDGKHILFREAGDKSHKLVLLATNPIRVCDSIQIGSPFFFVGPPNDKQFWISVLRKNLLKKYEVSQGDGDKVQLKEIVSIPFANLGGCDSAISKSNLLFSQCEGSNELKVQSLPELKNVKTIELSPTIEYSPYLITHDAEQIVKWNDTKIIKWKRNDGQYVLDGEWDLEQILLEAKVQGNP